MGGMGDYCLLYLLCFMFYVLLVQKKKIGKNLVHITPQIEQKSLRKYARPIWES